MDPIFPSLNLAKLTRLSRLSSQRIEGCLRDGGRRELEKVQSRKGELQDIAYIAISPSTWSNHCSVTWSVTWRRSGAGQRSRSIIPARRYPPGFGHTLHLKTLPGVPGVEWRVSPWEASTLNKEGAETPEHRPWLFNPNLVIKWKQSGITSKKNVYLTARLTIRLM